MALFHVAIAFIVRLCRQSQLRQRFAVPSTHLVICTCPVVCCLRSMRVIVQRVNV
jgi:hypothetical protein